MSDDAGMPVTDHPGAEEIAAYLSNALSPADRTNLETHLARCRACRRQVTSAQALLRTRPSHFRWVGIAAAAVLVIVLVRPWTFRDSPPSDVERERPGTMTGDIAIVPLTPADGDTISGTTLRFAWRSRGADVLYHLSVTDAQGRALWTASTRDTAISPPPNVGLESGARYFWYVDALGSNAASWTTGTRAFVVAP